MSIFEYDKELEEKKLRKAEYEAGFSEGEKHGIELNSKKSLWCGARRDGWSRPLPLGAPRPMISSW